LEQLESEEPSKAKSIIRVGQPKIANAKNPRSILDKFYSTSVEKQKVTSDDQEYYVFWNDLSRMLKTHIQSDQLRLQVTMKIGR